MGGHPNLWTRCNCFCCRVGDRSCRHYFYCEQFEFSIKFSPRFLKFRKARIQTGLPTLTFEWDEEHIEVGGKDLGDLLLSWTEDRSLSGQRNTLLPLQKCLGCDPTTIVAPWCRVYAHSIQCGEEKEYQLDHIYDDGRRRKLATGKSCELERSAVPLSSCPRAPFYLHCSTVPVRV